MADTFQIIIKKGPTPGRVIELTADEITVGREASNSLQINDRALSRSHARLTKTGSGYSIQDMGSTIDRETIVCPDRDRDGIPDSIDRCPDVAGPMDNWGCPAYKKIVVRRDKLELNEKLYFAWDEAVLQEVSFPVLDEVVQALKDNKGFRVQVEGHASSEGGDDHNQTLSEKRAEAVLAYLVAHGIDSNRLISKGFGSSVPLDTNGTIAGRENNRRVEFVVHFNILNEGSR